MMSACGGSSGSGGSSGADQNDSNKPSPENKDPITLKWSYNFGEETFKTYIKEPIEKKFPHITIELSSRERSSKMFGFGCRTPPFLCAPVLSFACCLPENII
ncbi:hypothetical protein [Paenibacillus sp. GCM10012303]|uniref:hypothetical protein n=1 Tax=Paenibacillus sp. GCM10012303 TaxID=3317340 RepID=UPI0036D4255A